MVSLGRLLGAALVVVLAGCQTSNQGPPVTASPTPAATETQPGLSSGQALPSPVGPAGTTMPSPSSAPTSAPMSGPTYSPWPQASIALAADGAPAMPTKVRLVETNGPCSFGTTETCAEWQLTWLEADPTDVAVRAYAVTQCLHPQDPAASTEVKCLLDGDVIPTKALVLLAEVPAETGTLTFQLATGQTSAIGWLPGNGPSVYAVVVQAVNADGGSLFAFAAVSGYCPSCTL